MHAKHHELFTQIYFIHWIHFRKLLLRLESLKKRRTLIVYRLDFNCPLWQKMTSQLVTFDRNSSVIVVENSDVLTSFSSTAPIFQNFRENSVVKYILWSSAFWVLKWWKMQGISLSWAAVWLLRVTFRSLLSWVSARS